MVDEQLMHMLQALKRVMRGASLRHSDFASAIVPLPPLPLSRMLSCCSFARGEEGHRSGTDIIGQFPGPLPLPCWPHARTRFLACLAC